MLRRSLFVASALSLAIALSACSPKIDGSSQKQVQASVEKMSKDLTAEKKKLFEDSLMAIGLKEEGDWLAIGKQVDGLTVDQVIEKGRPILDEFKAAESKAAAEERARDERELSRLQGKKRTQEVALQGLASIRASDGLVRIVRKDLGFGVVMPPEAVVDVTVTNGSDKTISQVTFRGKLMSPGREVPWATTGFGYTIPGGLRPGETQSWPLLTPEWDSLNSPSDARVQFETIMAEDAAGRPLFPYERYGESDEADIARLKKKLSGDTSGD